MIQTKPSDIRSFRQSDDYHTHYRLWGDAAGTDVIVLLHGGVSHSGWQAPLGEAISSNSGISFIATDRRGCGLNLESRGHLASADRVIDDVLEFLEFLSRSFTRIHLAGWCFGAQVASVAAARLADRHMLSTLMLIAPGFVFNERYLEVLSRSVESARAVVKEFQLPVPTDRAYLTVPLLPNDFTTRADHQGFIATDALRLTMVTESTMDVWWEIAERAEQDFARVGDLPILVVFGARDRLVDVERTHEFVIQQQSPHIETLDTGHAVHFEQAEALAELITSFASAVAAQPAATQTSE